jgi:hypothetical protein
VTGEFQSHAFINPPIFDSRIDKTFIPEHRRRREAFRYAEPAGFVLHNCRLHITNRFAEACDRERALPDHCFSYSSNQPQPLDLSIFAIRKTLPARVNRLDSRNIQSRHIAQSISTFLSAERAWRVPLPSLVPGCDEATETSSDDEEILPSDMIWRN